MQHLVLLVEFYVVGCTFFGLESQIKVLFVLVEHGFLLLEFLDLDSSQHLIRGLVVKLLLLIILVLVFSEALPLVAVKDPQAIPIFV